VNRARILNRVLRIAIRKHAKAKTFTFLSYNHHRHPAFRLRMQFPSLENPTRKPSSYTCQAPEPPASRSRPSSALVAGVRRPRTQELFAAQRSAGASAGVHHRIHPWFSPFGCPLEPSDAKPAAATAERARGAQGRRKTFIDRFVRVCSSRDRETGQRGRIGSRNVRSSERKAVFFQSVEGRF
jgi:hypothetical protein